MIPRSSYYKWLTHEGSVLESENKILMKEIIKIYNKVNGIYGYRRITLNLNSKLKKNYNYKRIYRLMRLSGLQSVIRRKKKRYVKSSPQQVADNILNRKFTADKLNQKWLTDVTEFKYGNSSKAHLSAILDLYDNSIVEYVLGHSNNNRLVFKN
jgi:putative transposase